MLIIVLRPKYSILLGHALREDEYEQWQDRYGIWQDGHRLWEIWYGYVSTSVHLAIQKLVVDFQR